MTDALGKSVSYEYDNLSRLLKETDPLRVSLSYACDLGDRLSEKVDGRVLVTRYKAGGGRAVPVPRPLDAIHEG